MNLRDDLTHPDMGEWNYLPSEGNFFKWSGGLVKFMDKFVDGQPQSILETGNLGLVKFLDDMLKDTNYEIT